MTEKNIFTALEEKLDLRKVEEAFRSFFGHIILEIVDKKNAFDSKNLENKFCKTIKISEAMKKQGMEAMKNCIKRCDKSKRTESIKCKSGHYGFCYPLIGEGKIAGYMVGCWLENEPSLELLNLFNYFTGITLKGILKEKELSELYESIKPRAIALSTVHTIHRLITSSLYLKELLSRIARLSMQIIKANRCSIKMIDSKRKVLLPKATVDHRTKKARLKKVKIGKWAPGKAVKYGKSIRDKRYLATPLIDEDVIGVITLYDKIDARPFNRFDEEIMKTLAEQSAIAIRNAQLYKEQEQLTMGSIKILAQIIESKCPGLHTPKTSFLRIVHLIGQEFNLREYELKLLQYATLLHDTGELMVPEKLLRKKGKLTEKEYRLIKEHPLKGAKIIKSLKSLKSVAPIIMYHHENFDGTGYPAGLSGTEIPIGARIMAVVAAFEAMITKRPYRVALTVERAVGEIKKNSGKQFDPEVVQVFANVMKRKDIRNLIKRGR